MITSLHHGGTIGVKVKLTNCHMNVVERFTAYTMVGLLVCLVNRSHYDYLEFDIERIGFKFFHTRNNLIEVV